MATFCKFMLLLWRPVRCIDGKLPNSKYSVPKRKKKKAAHRRKHLANQLRGQQRKGHPVGSNYLGTAARSPGHKACIVELEGDPCGIEWCCPLRKAKKKLRKATQSSWPKNCWPQAAAKHTRHPTHTVPSAADKKG